MIEVPSKVMDRDTRTLTLGDILERKTDGSPRYFDHRMRPKSNLKYRIPIHQRYPQWKDEQREKLIDTVFRNFPMSGIVVSRHVDDDSIYYDFEDGQTRMSILQDFYMDRFPFRVDNGDAIKFSELPREKQRAFENYKICIEELSEVSNYDISEVFDRLQNGKPLSDKDLYWNRKDEFPYVRKAISLIKEEYWLSTYMNTEKGITDKHRNHLPDTVTFIYAIINYNKNKSSISTPSNRKSFWKCYRAQVLELKDEITESDNNRIKKFLIYLNYIINTIYTTLEPRTCKPKEKVNTWGNLAKQTGLILYEWLENEHESKSLHKKNQDKWIEIMLIERKSSDFMYKGTKTMWDGLKSSHKGNTDDDSIASRLNRVNEFYENRILLQSRIE